MSENPKNPSFLKECLSVLLDFVPFVGSGKSGIEFIQGKDVITGEHINRWLSGGGIILGVVPFGKVFTKGKKSKEMIEYIANKITYGARNKEELIKKMEKVIPTSTKEIDEGFILQEIKEVLKPGYLQYRYSMKLDPLKKGSDLNLVHQYLVQMNYGGHAVHKHWFSEGHKAKLLPLLSKKQQKKIKSQLTDEEEVVEYLKLVLKDPKTEKLVLPTPTGKRIGFANAEKKVIIIHNPHPEHQGTFYYKDDPISELTKIYDTSRKK